MTDELVAWIGCQNCQETKHMTYIVWAEKLKEGICPAGEDMHLAQCARALSVVVFG